MKEAVAFFKLGERYKLPIPCIADSNIKLQFEYLGLAGNGTKLQFKEVHGGWTVTLAPVQLIGAFDEERKSRSKYA